jgi:hypothetical protein
MRTAKQMIVAVGQRVCLNCDGLHVDCTVKDVKSAWGRERVLLVPVAGTGERWVELSSLVMAQSVARQAVRS